jgi:FkbM family methyltransferase
MRLIEDGERVLELGAGLGFISSLIALNKNIAAYHMIEADSRLADLIRRTHALNGVQFPFTLESCMVHADSNGFGTFYVCSKFSASSARGPDHRGRTIEKVTVPARTLNSLIEEFQPTCVIADVEGSEEAIFANSALQGVQKVMIELHPEHIGQAGVRTIFQAMDRLGFIYEPPGSTGGIVSFRRST